MPEFKYDSSVSLGNIIQNQLGDDFQTELIAIGIEESQKGKTGDFTYELGGSLEFRVELFNSDNDQDKKHGILGKSKPLDANSVDWQPLVERSANDAWLKYTTSAAVKLGSQIDFGPVLGMKANGSVEHFYYHKHLRSKLVGNAVAADMADQKSVFSLDDVINLGPDQCVGIAAGGQVQLSFKISWSDIFATGMPALAELLDVPQAIAINVSAGANVEMRLTIDDSFKLAFVGVPGGSVRFALRKARSSTFTTGLTIGIEAEFADPNAIEKVLNEVLAGLLSISLSDFESTVKDLKKHLELDDLTERRREIAEEIIERLGIDDEISKTKDLLDKLLELEKKTKSRITNIAKSKAKFSFSYEYSRIETDASIYEADFTKDAVRRTYKDILAGRIQVLLAHANVNPGEIRTRRFLNQKSLEIKSAIGLSLGIGRWSLSGKEHKFFKFVEQRNAENAIRLALLGSRKYEGDGFGEKESTFVEFKADMDNFVPAGISPSLSDFKLGLSLSFRESQSRISEKELNALLDLALVFGAGPEGDLDRLAAETKETVGLGGKTDSEVIVTMSNSEVREFASWIAVCSERDLGAAFASAMEYWAQYPSRHYILSRRIAYSEFWERALMARWKNAAEAAGVAAALLWKFDSQLARRELRAIKRGDMTGQTIFRLYKLNKDLLVDFERTRSAFARLHRAVRDNESYEVLKDITRDIHKFVNTRFKIRVMAALINSYHKSSVSNPGEINAALRITHNQGNKTLNIGYAGK